MVIAADSLRWVPHSQMAADGLTKAGLVKTNGASEHLVKTLHFTLVQEQSGMQQRSECPQFLLRSRSAAEDTRNEATELSDEATWNVFSAR